MNKLKEGKITFGSWITIGHPIVAEIMANSGFDWLTIDMEHSAITLDIAQNLIRTIELSGCTPLVRVRKNNPMIIKQVMDAGAHGVIIPMVNSKEEAEKAAAVKFAYFITQPELAANFSMNTGYIAVQKSAYDTSAMKAYLKKVPQAADTRDALNFAAKELSLQNLGQIRNIFHKYLQAAYNGEMTAAEAMKTAQEEADKSLADFK